MLTREKYENINEELQGRRRSKNSRLLVHESEDLVISTPIIDYSQEKLLPLNETCQPLIPIVHDILFYASYALKHTPEHPADGLTRDESAAIRLYTIEWCKEHQSLYSLLNEILRRSDRDKLQPWLKYLKLLVTALVKIPCAPAQTVWRGIKMNISDKFNKSNQVTWWAFSSTTTSLDVLENDMYLGVKGERTIFSIETINGRNISAHSQYDNEDEILLLPGTQMEVQSTLSPGTGLHIIHLKQKIPEQILLELPFQGACLYPKYKYLNRHWYGKKRYLIPMNILLFLCIVGVILGTVFGLKSANIKTTESLLKTRSICPSKIDNICSFSTNYTLTSDGYYGTQRLYINCSTDLSNIIVRFLVQKTVGAICTRYYNSFAPNLIQSCEETNSVIIYKWTSIPGQLYTTDKHETYTDAQFQLKGINQTMTNDFYYATLTIACNSQQINTTGHF